MQSEQHVIYRLMAAGGGEGDIQWKRCYVHSWLFVLNGSSLFLQVTSTTIKA